MTFSGKKTRTSEFETLCCQWLATICVVDKTDVSLTWVSLSRLGSKVRLGNGVGAWFEGEGRGWVWESRIIMGYGGLGWSMAGVPAPDVDCAAIELHGPKTGDYSGYDVKVFGFRVSV